VWDILRDGTGARRQLAIHEESGSIEDVVRGIVLSYRRDVGTVPVRGESPADLTRILGVVAGPELSVVCRNCGSEVSPYVTGCPYCGTRLRKRAPRLEREGDEIKIREGRREKKLRRDAERRERASERRAGFSRAEELGAKPLATIALLAIPAILYVILMASGSVRGAVVVEANELFSSIFDAAFDDGPLRYLVAPFFFVSAGYLFICGVGIAIFGTGVERRLGTIPTLILGVACGSLGILAADGISNAIGNGAHLASGANGTALGLLAAYVALREPDRRADPDESYDPVAVGVAAAVLLAAPLVFTLANPWAGIAGGLVGGLCGWTATMAGRRA
jgi:membrane associated rhomboid family serine protease